MDENKDKKELTEEEKAKVWMALGAAAVQSKNRSPWWTHLISYFVLGAMLMGSAYAMFYFGVKILKLLGVGQ